MTVHCENGQVSDAAAGTIMLQDAPMRMALPSHENTLAVALGDGGILKFSISRDADGIPVLQQTQGNASFSESSILLHHSGIMLYDAPLHMTMRH